METEQTTETDQRKVRAKRKPRGGIWNRGTKDKPQWYCRFVDVDGKQKTKHTHQPSKELAEKFLTNIKANIARGVAGHPKVTKQEKERRALTVGELIKTFRDEYNGPRVKDRRQWRTNLGCCFSTRFEPFPIADKIVGELKIADIEGLRTALLSAKYAPSSVNQALGYLGTAFNWAIERELVPPIRNPVALLKKLAITPLEERYSTETIHELLQQADDTLLPILAFSLYTGCRPGEARGLRWESVRLDAQIPHVEIKYSYRTTPKTAGSRRLVPIHPELLPILRLWQKRCPKTEENLVFPVVPQNRPIRMAQRRDDYGLPQLLRALKLHVPVDRATRRPPKARCWHTFRHTLCSALFEAGASGDAISRILGHSGGGSAAPMTLTYAHVSLEYLARELGRVSFTPPPIAGVTPLRRPVEKA